MTSPVPLDPRTATGTAAGLNPGSRIPLRDVTDAARILLARGENREYVAWHPSRWYDDDRVLEEIAYERRQELLGERGTWPYPPVFNNIWCQEILHSALPVAPEDAIDCLTELRLTSTTDAAVLHAAFRLIDPPAHDWYAAIDDLNLPLAEVVDLRTLLGDPALTLAFTLGWTADLIRDAANDRTGDSARALEALAALRT